MTATRRSKEKRVTLKAVAKAVGLSTSAVSMALGDYPQISEATRRRVRTACEKMGYQPVVRRSSTWQQSNRQNPEAKTRLGFVIVDNRERVKLDSIGELESLAQHCPAMSFDLQVAVIRSSDPAKQAEELNQIAASVDALLLYNFVTRRMLDVSALTKPAVLLGDLRGDYLRSDDRITNVTCDARTMGELATRSLLKAGHDRIAFICASLKEGMWYERWLMGYRHAHSAARILVNPELEWIMGSRPNIGAHAARKARNFDQIPTAYVIPDPRTASTFLDAMETAGKLPPREAVVVGGSTQRVAEYGLDAYPNIAQDDDQLIRCALSRLRAMLDGQESNTCSISVPFHVRNLVMNVGTGLTLTSLNK